MCVCLFGGFITNVAAFNGVHADYVSQLLINSIFYLTRCHITLLCRNRNTPLAYAKPVSLMKTSKHWHAQMHMHAYMLARTNN